MSPVIEGRGLHRSLAGVRQAPLVDDVSLTVEAGEFLSIVGPSGCGKSSLLYLLALIDRPTRGEILVGGQRAARMDDRERTRLRLERIGCVFQFHFLLPELTAAQNVALPMRRLNRLSTPQIRERTGGLLHLLGIQALGDRRPDTLSGGQRQRVAIARALANDPPLLLCDEPTGNLDSGNTRAVIEEFRRLAAEGGRSIVCVTHDEQVAAAADRRLTMLDGRLTGSTGSRRPVKPQGATSLD